LRQRTLDSGVEASPILHMPFGDIFTIPAAHDLQNVVLLRDK